MGLLHSHDKLIYQDTYELSNIKSYTKSMTSLGVNIIFILTFCDKHDDRMTLCLCLENGFAKHDLVVNVITQ